MGKWVADEVLDNALAVIGSATHMVAVAGAPADFGAAWDGRLVEVALLPGDFAVGAGEVSGRRIAVAGKEEVEALADGTADHVALLELPGSRLLYVTTCPPQAIVAGGSVSFDQWSVEIGAPL